MPLPIISNPNQLMDYLQRWRSELKNSVKSVVTPAIPWNFQGKSQQGGNLFTWSVVRGADGYEIQRSDNGDFTTAGAFITVPIKNVNQTSYFDAVSNSGGGAPPLKYYRIRATAGTISEPQTVKGLFSGVVALQAIAANDNVTASTSKQDTTTTDTSQSFTRYFDGKDISS